MDNLKSVQTFPYAVILIVFCLCSLVLHSSGSGWFYFLEWVEAPSSEPAEFSDQPDSIEDDNDLAYILPVLSVVAFAGSLMARMNFLRISGWSISPLLKPPRMTAA